MKNLFRELKRRNIYKSAFAYVAVCWVILQASELLLSIYDFPDSYLKGVLIFLITGFPAWLIFSWFYEYSSKGYRKTEDLVYDRPGSVPTIENKRQNAIIIGGMALAIIILVADRVFDITGAIVDQKENLSIAVLPLMNFGSADDNYFAAGISEDILTQLSKIGDLRILSSFTLRDYDSEGKTPNQIGEELDVTYVLRMSG